MCQERKPHKHAEVIKAWADGAEIQFRYRNDNLAIWSDIANPTWKDECEYRIKPKEPIVRYVTLSVLAGSEFRNPTSNITAKFDPETGELVSISMI